MQGQTVIYLSPLAYTNLAEFPPNQPKYRNEQNAEVDFNSNFVLTETTSLFLITRNCYNLLYKEIKIRNFVSASQTGVQQKINLGEEVIFINI